MPKSGAFAGMLATDYDDAPSGQPYADRMATEPVSDEERAVLEKLNTYAVVMRDAAARLDMDDQWRRYATVSTVVDEVLANGWEGPDEVLAE